MRLAFAPTPRMSSYLLALVAGELERVTAEADGTELGVVVTAGKAGRAQFALEAGKQLLPYYGDYFGSRYPLPKLDQIGVPGGFGGAMENWGAIVYTEAAPAGRPGEHAGAHPADRLRHWWRTRSRTSGSATW